jgi:hypothetical protein
VVDGYTSRGLPLHVLVMDMEWHAMLGAPGCTQFEGKSTWGGYSWNKTLFPDPASFVTKMHAVGGWAHDGVTLGTKVAVNYHPDSGLDACQDGYAAMAKVPRTCLCG